MCIVCVCVYGRTGSGCVYGWKGENWFTLLDQYIVNIDWIDPESADSPTTCLRTPPPPPNSGHLLPPPSDPVPPIISLYLEATFLILYLYIAITVGPHLRKSMKNWRS